MDFGLGVSLGAAIVSGATLVYGAMAFRQTARRDDLEAAMAQIKDLREQLIACRAECERFRSDNLDLMRRLLKDQGC